MPLRSSTLLKNYDNKTSDSDDVLNENTNSHSRRNEEMKSVLLTVPRKETISVSQRCNCRKTFHSGKTFQGKMSLREKISFF